MIRFTTEKKDDGWEGCLENPNGLGFVLWHGIKSKKLLEKFITNYKVGIANAQIVNIEQIK